MITEHERHYQFILVVKRLQALGPECAILVEGIKDESALRSIDVKAPIIRLKGPDNLVDVSENAARTYSKLVILTDWDRTGGQIAKRVREVLKGWNVVIDNEIRRDLAILSTKEIRTVEGVPSYYHRALLDKVAIDMLKEKPITVNRSY